MATDKKYVGDWRELEQINLQPLLSFVFESYQTVICTECNSNSDLALEKESRWLFSGSLLTTFEIGYIFRAFLAKPNHHARLSLSKSLIHTVK